MALCFKICGNKSLKKFLIALVNIHGARHWGSYYERFLRGSLGRSIFQPVAKCDVGENWEEISHSEEDVLKYICASL